MITYKTIDREEAILEPEAEEIAANGSHEARVFEALRKSIEGLTVSELEAAVGDKNVVKVGQGKAFKSKWISKGKEGRLVASVSFFWQYSNSRNFTPRWSRCLLQNCNHIKQSPGYQRCMVYLRHIPGTMGI